MYISFKKIKDFLTSTKHDSMKVVDILTEVDKAYDEAVQKLPIYVSLAQRYGSSEAHHYFRGVFRTLEEAIADAEKHYQDRAGKYYMKIYRDRFDGTPKLVFDQGEYEIAKTKLRQRERGY